MVDLLRHSLRKTSELVLPETVVVEKTYTRSSLAVVHPLHVYAHQGTHSSSSAGTFRIKRVHRSSSSSVLGLRLAVMPHTCHCTWDADG